VRHALIRGGDYPTLHQNDLDIGRTFPILFDCLIGGTPIPPARSLHIWKFDCDNSFDRAFSFKQRE
jgi:hypothetical protein